MGGTVMPWLKERVVGVFGAVWNRDVLAIRPGVGGGKLVAMKAW